MTSTDSVLQADQIESFVSNGFVRLEGGFTRATAAECREWLWRELKIDPDDPTGWNQPVVRFMGSTAQPFVDAANTPRIHGALDQLVGKGRWRPQLGLGTFAIRFPSKSDPEDAGWHVDGSYQVGEHLFLNLQSKSRALLMLYLFSEIGNLDVPTRIWIGSHLRVPGILRSAGEAGLPFFRVTEQLRSPKPSEIAFATGAPGDVYLCHPFLIHAADWPHRGKYPRVIAQPGLEPTDLLHLDRDDRVYSPVEQAVRQALGMVS